MAMAVIISKMAATMKETGISTEFKASANCTTVQAV